MKKLMTAAVVGLGCLLLLSSSCYAASARCVVVTRAKTKMVIECGKNVNGFQEGQKIKIKTDRGKK
ncbi:hypothetical protein [Desulforhopalus singaporensis]|uniref:Uncharacterized protein n=1 Tax=Desulforhopalus singaporensis TaxID=91360 RepID=A0A1H0QMA7_9BACT|nr:hypothetical protein [Desulforhopalus singaporensis]SDP18454.1 hypothetical protein SAMN05660330_02033 [Desulforhopalus singaporensis]